MLKLLKTHFGFDQFRPLQEEIIREVMAGRDALVLMPTGGVDCTEESLRAWFGAGVACVGMGSNLITKELLQAGDFGGIARKVETTLALIEKIRGGK